MADFTFLHQFRRLSNLGFDGSPSTAGLGRAITNYVWELGDNNIGTGLTASHQVIVSGTYFAKLTVTDSNGLSGENQTKAVL